MNHSVIYINKRAVSSKTNCETRYDQVFLRLFLVKVHSKTIPGSTLIDYTKYNTQSNLSLAWVGQFALYQCYKKVGWQFNY